MITNTDIKKLLGKKIKELRLKKGYTQEQLSELIGVGERNLSKIECGNNFITSETLANLVNILEIEAKDLFNFKHLREKDELKKELIEAIINESVDIKLMYQFYETVK